MNRLFKTASSVILIFFLIISSFYGQTKKTVRVGFLEESSVFMDYDRKTGKRSGYAYEYLQKISNLTGWEYEYIHGNWPYLYSLLLKGEIDLLPGMTLTQERQKSIYFPKSPMGIEIINIYTDLNNNSINQTYLQSLNGKKIAIEKSSSTKNIFLQWCRENDVHPVLKEYPDNLYQALDNKEVDAVIDSDLFTHKNYYGAIQLQSSPIYTGININKKNIAQEYETAAIILNQINPLQTYELRNKYFRENSSIVRLSIEEHLWLEKHYNQIKVGLISDIVPYCNYNKTTQRAEGAGVDFLKRLTESLNEQGISIHFSFYENIDELTSSLQNGEIDILFPAIYDLNEAENNNYVLSEVFSSVDMGIAYRKDNNTLTQDKISIPKNKISEVFLNSAYPDCQVSYEESRSDCIKSVLNNKSDATVMSLYNLNFAIQKERNKSALRVFPLSENVDICFAVRKSSPELLTLINKRLNSVSYDETGESVKLHIARITQELKKDQQRYFINFTVITLLFIILVSVLFYLTKDRIQFLTNTDPVTRLATKKQFKKRIKEAVSQARQDDTPLSLVYFDTDNFKKTVKTHGKSVKNEILSSIAEVIKSSTKKEDEAFKIGLDKFYIIMKTDMEKTVKATERIMKTVSQENITTKKACFPVSLSAGVCTYSKELSARELCALTDKKLFEAKASGPDNLVWK